jgi:CheY-like chemotaxis protein
VNMLAGKTILVVEDEALVAEMLVDMLVGLGAAVIGPATTFAMALEFSESEGIDAAVLDINLRGERVDPIADRLRARGIPVLFATGYGVAAGEHCRDAPVIDKPYTQERLASALMRALAMSKPVGSDTRN